MPINPEAVGSRPPPTRRRWDSGDCFLYALAVGAGADNPLAELEFTTENSTSKTPRVLPTMAVVLGADLGTAFDSVGEFDHAMLVHGEQAIELDGEIPLTGEVETVSEITGVYDKGKGALVVLESVSRLVHSPQPLFRARASVFIRGEGGWGGDRGPSGTGAPMPERAPDDEIMVRTRSDQALLYRLCGDRNPLHADPVFAAAGGFERPILHGLCTYGFTGRALLHARCGSDPSRFRAMEARFSAPVFPGETLTVQVWDDDTAVRFRTLDNDRRIVVDAGQLTVST